MSETITVTLKGEKKELRISEIEYVTGCENYSYIHVAGQPKPFLIARTLKYVSERMPHFLRIHKQTLVNPTHIKAHSHRNNSQSVVRMNSDILLAVSRRRAATLVLPCKP